MCVVFFFKYLLHYLLNTLLPYTIVKQSKISFVRFKFSFNPTRGMGPK